VQGRVALRPGRHYLHVARDGVIGGRTVVDITPRETTRWPTALTREQLAAARGAWLADPRAKLPEEVRRGLASLEKVDGGPVFLAAIDDGRVEIAPYTGGAQLRARQPVTVVLYGEGGPAIVVSPLFDESAGAMVTAPAAAGAMGVEVGIFNAAIVGGFDLAITPGETVTYANSDGTDNVSSPALPQPWGGLGGYLLRPTGQKPTMLIAGTMGWNGPAHLGVGGRIAFGLPLQDGLSWFRLSLGGSTAAAPLAKWQPVVGEYLPMHVVFLRVGIATQF
jgi:hypothetical protein